ncbi:MAG: hydrogenase maturation protease [Nitrospiraceae bacterium]|nr:hydrogenase maturation protease [Nitrospiraceae bacterium]
MTSSSAVNKNKRILLLGYGNPGREDDGLGPALIERIEALNLPDVTVDADYQLNIEDATACAENDVVLFVDASKDADEPYELRRLEAASEITFTTHTVSAESVLAICEDHFNGSPDAWILAIRGYSFEFTEGLTQQAADNLEQALSYVRSLIGTWKEQAMDTSKKTILAIDDDPDIRAALRVVLEAEGFAVGEASTGEEGIKVAERTQPDAIICDLMMENVDSGTTVARSLKESGYAGPIYMLSSAGDTVRYNLDARELGLAGIFQKPIDPRTLVATLRAKLG